MKRILIALLAALVLLILIVALSAGWYIHTKQPVRSGTVAMAHLREPVKVRYDERGVPHIEAQNEEDMYRALGFVQAQDRLFQMEMLRRLANGELAEVLGSKFVGTDKLLRTLGIRRVAREQAEALDLNKPSSKALLAYLDGINQFQSTHRPPLEFDLLHLPQRDFTVADSFAANAYFAYSFSPALYTEPLMTYIRDKLGPQYLADFDIDWHPEGAKGALALGPARNPSALALNPADWTGLNQLAALNRATSDLDGMPQFQGSNGWAISGSRTASGKPVLAGDPHIKFSVPAVWYEAHISCPGVDLYGHYIALSPSALLGHNANFGWTLTILGNIDISLVAEKPNPYNANQIWYQDKWIDLPAHSEVIHVKDEPDVRLRVRQSPHGPIVSDVVATGLERTPVAMWWAYQQTEQTLQEAFYALNRASTLDRAREAASQIHAPGLNVIWANASGDIAWWAAAKVAQRPAGVNPVFILDGAKGEAEIAGYYNFTFNPHEENPRRGYVLSANQQPQGPIPIPGFYSVPDRFMELDKQLSDPTVRWTADDTRVLQRDVCNGYSRRVLEQLLPVLDQVVTDPIEHAFLEPLQKWDGCYDQSSVAATFYTQISYELARAAFADKLDDDKFAGLLRSTALDFALPRLAADAKSPWWDNTTTPDIENRFETVRIAWVAAVKHMKKLYGTNLTDWAWGNNHTLTFNHPLGQRKPLDLLFNRGPVSIMGGHETPAAFQAPVGPAPWSVTAGPSTRTIIDFARPERALGINPLGQSGVWFDRHYADQMLTFIDNGYQPEHLGAADIAKHTQDTLTLNPALTD